MNRHRSIRRQLDASQAQERALEHDPIKYKIIAARAADRQQWWDAMSSEARRLYVEMDAVIQPYDFRRIWARAGGNVEAARIAMKKHVDSQRANEARQHYGPAHPQAGA